MGNPMNTSFYFLDRGTHRKIILLAAILAGVVLAVGENAQLGHAARPAAVPAPPAQGLKAFSPPAVAQPAKREAV